MSVVALDVFEDDVFEDAIYADFTSDYVDRLDITNKIVFIKDDVITFHPVDDVYSEVRSIRRIDESIRVMDNPVSAQGNEPAGDNFTPRRAVFNHGWRIGIEFPVNWTLSITGEMISDDGFAGSQLVKLEYMPNGISALVNYTPPSSEVIVPDSAGGLTVEQDNQLMSVPLNPLLSIDARLDHMDNLPILSDIREEMINVQFGELEIANNQMVIKDKVGIVIAILDLFDKNGNPNMNSVFKREVVS